MITITNHGPLIVATNYWGSEAEQAGKLFCSTNGGAVRILVPRSLRVQIDAMRRDSKYAIFSRGPWPQIDAPEAVEILFEDGTDNPYTLHLTAASFDLLPGEPPPDKQWVLSVWDQKKGKPHKALERPCYWRRVERIPCGKPWEGTLMESSRIIRPLTADEANRVANARRKVEAERDEILRAAQAAKRRVEDV